MWGAKFAPCQCFESLGAPVGLALAPGAPAPPRVRGRPDQLQRRRPSVAQRSPLASITIGKHEVCRQPRHRLGFPVHGVATHFVAAAPLGFGGTGRRQPSRSAPQSRTCGPRIGRLPALGDRRISPVTHPSPRPFVDVRAKMRYTRRYRVAGSLQQSCCSASFSYVTAEGMTAKAVDERNSDEDFARRDANGLMITAFPDRPRRRRS